MNPAVALTAVIATLNSLLTSAFTLLFWPFQNLDPLWALLFVSFLTGIVMLWFFGKVSNQKAIEGLRNRTRGNLLAVLLYQHDIKVVLRLHGLILRDTVVYLRYTLLPILILTVPLVPMLAQLNLFFSSRPLQPGEAAVVTLRVDDLAVVPGKVNLESNSAVKVETPGVRIPREREIAWRVRAVQPGTHRLVFRIGQDTVEKNVRVGGRWGAVSARKTGNWLDLLLYPGEDPLGSGERARSIEVRYEPLSLSVMGWTTNWLILFFVLSIVVSFAFKGVLGVEL
jgi:phage-related holin